MLDRSKPTLRTVPQAAQERPGYVSLQSPVCSLLQFRSIEAAHEVSAATDRGGRQSHDPFEGIEMLRSFIRKQRSEFHGRLQDAIHSRGK